MKKAILFFLYLNLLLGCAATGSKFSGETMIESSDDAVIYLYRTFNFIGSVAFPNVYVDGVKVGNLKTGGYLPLYVPVGEHEIVIGRLNGDSPNWAPDNASYKVAVNPGEEYYLRMETNFGKVMPLVIPVGPTPIIGFVGKAGITITTLSRADAIPQLSKTKLSK